MTCRSPRVLAAFAACLFVGLALVAGAAAGETVPGVEAWLDRPLPTDARPGTSVQIGAILWSRESNAPIATSVFVRVHPASGDGVAAEVATRQDWPGHVVAQVTVPAGGFGELEIGTTGSACTASGCVRSDALYAVAGVGPPPGAPLTTIATASVVPPAEQLVAAKALEYEVVLVPRAGWDAAAMPWPDELTLQVRRPREPVLAEAPMRLEDAPSGTYRGSIVVPERGTFVFQVALSAGDDATAVFGGSAISLDVEPPVDGAPEPEASPPIQLALAAVLGAAVLGGVILLLVRRADL